jgi:hypothetical protein
MPVTYWLAIMTPTLSMELHIQGQLRAELYSVYPVEVTAP